MGKTIDPVFIQGTYRWRNDDGGLDGATWAAAEKVGYAVTKDTTIRLRTVIGEQAAQNVSAQFAARLQYRINGGTWTTLTSATSVRKANSSQSIADGATETTARLSTGPTGVVTFTSAEFDEDNTTASVELVDMYKELEYTLEVDSSVDDRTPFHVTAAALTPLNHDYSSETTASEDLAISADGLVAYIVSSTTIYQYSRSSVLEEFTYDNKSFSLSGQTTTATGLYLDSTGQRLFVTDSGNNTVYRYLMSTALDLDTIAYQTDSLSTDTEITSLEGGTFHPDGTIFYAVDGGSDTIYQYSGTAWQLSAFSYDSRSLDIGAQAAFPSGFRWNGDGTQGYAIDPTNDDVLTYAFTSAYDISSGSYDNAALDVNPQDSTMNGLDYDSAGDFLYTAGFVNSKIFQYGSGRTLIEFRLSDDTQGAIVTADATPLLIISSAAILEDVSARTRSSMHHIEWGFISAAAACTQPLDDGALT